MRETSYHAVIAEMTVRALWELQNLLDCIPDALWDRCYGGAPLWQHVYHTKLSIYLTSLHDEDLLQRPDNCEWTRFTLILSQYRHLYRHMGMVMGFIEAETGLCPRTLEVGEDPPAAPYDPYQ